MRTPLVIAMWEPMAKALGWPKKQISFDQIVKLATAPDGWASAGKPQFGTLQVRPHQPGLLDLRRVRGAGSYYAFVSKKEGLTEADVAKARAAGQGARALDRPLRRHDAVHRGPALPARPRLRERGGDGGDDGDRLQPPRVPLRQLVAVYPHRGLVLLRLAANRRSTRRLGDAGEAGRAREAFAEFLAEKVTPEVAGSYGFRPGDPDVDAVGPRDRGQRRRPRAAARVLRLPEPQVLNKCSRPGGATASRPT